MLSKFYNIITVKINKMYFERTERFFLYFVYIFRIYISYLYSLLRDFLIYCSLWWVYIYII